MCLRTSVYIVPNEESNDGRSSISNVAVNRQLTSDRRAGYSSCRTTNLMDAPTTDTHLHAGD